MSAVRTGLLVLLVVLLAVDLAAANAVVAADRTVLNADYVTTTLEEEGAYEQLEPLVLEQLPTGELEGEDTPPLPIDTEVVVSAALDSDYLQSQAEPNIEQIYAYLHGDSDQLDLSIDLEPAKAAIVNAVEAELTNASATELVDAFGAEEELSVEASGVTIELATVAEMAESQSTFETERAQLRAQIRDEVLTRLVDRAFDEATNDQLLSLVIADYDPDDYTESEKEQLVADNEPEIRTALRDRLEAEEGDEIDAEVDRQLAENREQIRAEATTAINERLSGTDPAIRESATELMLVAVDGYVADVTHAEFSAAFEAALDGLASSAAGVLEAELDEQLPDELDLTEDLDPSATQGLEQARQAVGYIDLAAIGLPALGALLWGLIYLVSRSVAVTAIGGGIGLTLGGLPALVGAGALPNRLEAALAGNELPSGVADLLLAIADQTASAVVLQSGLVVGVGVVVLAVGLALQYELIELPVGR